MGKATVAETNQALKDWHDGKKIKLLSKVSGTWKRLGQIRKGQKLYYTHNGFTFGNEIEYFSDIKPI